MNFVWQTFPKHTSSTNGYFYTATGGIVFGGTSPYNRGRHWTPSGGIEWGGSTEVHTSSEPREYEYTMTGGVEWNGTFPVLGHTWTSVLPEDETEWTDVEGF